MGAEDDHRAWSAYGGRWRAVRVRYPRLGFAWGRKPAIAFLTGLVMAGAGYVGLRLMLGLRGWTDGHPAGDDAAGWIRAGSTVLAAAALLVVARGVWTMLRAALDLISRQEVEGQVVRRRSYSRGNDKTAHFIAVDSGRSDRVKAWLVPAGVYARFREGAVVRATVGPRLGHVFEVELVTGPRVAATATGTGETREQPVAAGPEAGVDPVRVVTAEDAGVALGELVGPARALLQQPLPVGGCAAASARRCRVSGGGSVSVFTAAGDLVRLLVRVNQRFGDAVEGVGDQAFLRGEMVVVIRGDMAVSIRVQGDRVADRPAALRRLATVAAGRLGEPSSQMPPDRSPMRRPT